MGIGIGNGIGKDGGGVVARARARPSIEPADESALIGPILFKRFAETYPGEVNLKGATRTRFLELAKADGQADAIINGAMAYAERTSPDDAMPVKEWLDDSAIKPRSLIPRSQRNRERLDLAARCAGHRK